MLNPIGFNQELSLKGTEYRVITPGRAVGRITGGCLSLLISLLGTPFFPDLDGWMLFFEDTGEPPHRIYRMLTQLRLAGVFDRVRAVLIGSLGLPLPEPIVAQALKGLRIPLVTGIPSGHMIDMTPLPFGIEAQLDTQEGKLYYLESPFLG
jgi:muramoyltetrapeptide carboxypeptidase